MIAPSHPALVASVSQELARPSETSARLSLSTYTSLRAAIAADRLAGWISKAITSGVIEAESGVAEAVTQEWHRQLAACVIIESRVVSIAKQLAEEGVSWRLLKGPAVAHLDYPDPALRTFGDVDALIHPDHWERAVMILTGHGWRRHSDEIAPGFDARFGKGVTLRDDSGNELDLHRRLAVGRFGLRVPAEDLFANGTEIILGGVPVPALAGPERLVHASLHATIGGWNYLRASRDIAQQVLVSGVDWRAAAFLAGRWRVTAPVAGGIAAAWQVLDLDRRHPAYRWASAVEVSRIDQYVMKVFAEEQAFSRQALTAVPDMVGRGATAYLWQLAVKPGWRRRAGRPR